jgi:hypothetical protein
MARYVTFFNSPDFNVLPVVPAVCDGAARIRAQYGFKPLDALHLAAAVEHGCTRFLGNDAQLKRLPDILAELLSCDFGSTEPTSEACTRQPAARAAGIHWRSNTSPR